MSRRLDPYREAARERPPTGDPRFRPENRFPRRQSIDRSADFYGRRNGPPGPHGDWGREPPPPRKPDFYGADPEFPHYSDGVLRNQPPNEFDRMPHAIGDQFGDEGPTPSSFKRSPNPQMREMPPPLPAQPPFQRFRDAPPPQRDGAWHMERRRRPSILDEEQIPFGGEAGDHREPPFYEHHTPYGVQRRPFGDPALHREAPEVEMGSHYRGPFPPELEGGDRWGRPPMGRPPPQRPSLTADLHARERRAINAERLHGPRPRFDRPMDGFPHDTVDVQIASVADASRLHPELGAGPFIPARSSRRPSFDFHGPQAADEARHFANGPRPYDMGAWTPGTRDPRESGPYWRNDYRRPSVTFDRGEVGPSRGSSIMAPLNRAYDRADGFLRPRGLAERPNLATPIKKGSVVEIARVERPSMIAGSKANHEIDDNVNDVLDDEGDTPKKEPEKHSLQDTGLSLKRLAEIEGEMAQYRELIKIVNRPAEKVRPPSASERVEEETAGKAGDETNVCQIQSDDIVALQTEEEEDLQAELTAEEDVVVSDPELGTPDQILVAKVLQNNRRRAQRAFMTRGTRMLMSDEDRIRALYSSPVDLPFYQSNIEKHRKIRGAIVAKVAARFIDNAARRTQLQEEFDERTGDWRRSINALEDDKAKKRRRLAKSGMLSSANPAGSTTPGAGAYGSPGGVNPFARTSRRSTFTSDTVRTEAEFQEALAMLGIADDDPTNHDPHRSCKEPDMVLDPTQKSLLQYEDYNNLVYDPAADLEEYNARLALIWSEEEQAIFREKVLYYGKNFHSIARHLPFKDTQDCVHYYYREKNLLNLKTLIKRAQRRAKVQAAAAKRAGREVSDGRERPYLLFTQDDEPPPASTPRDAQNTGRGGRRTGRGKEGTAKTGRSGAADPKEDTTTRRARRWEEEANQAQTMDSTNMEIDTQVVTSTEKTRNKIVETTTEVTTTVTRTHKRGASQDVLRSKTDSPQKERTDSQKLAIETTVESETIETTQILDEVSVSLSVDSPVQGASPDVEGEGMEGAVDARNRRRGRRREIDDVSGLTGIPDMDGVEGGGAGNDQDLPKRTISYWNTEETVAFRDAYATFGKDWELVSQKVGSKSAKQAQNFYKRNQFEMDVLRTGGADTPNSELDLVDSPLISETTSPTKIPETARTLQRRKSLVQAEVIHGLTANPAVEPVETNGPPKIRSSKLATVLNIPPKPHPQPAPPSLALTQWCRDIQSYILDPNAAQQRPTQRLVDHASLLTHANREAPHQAASAVAAQRVVKLAQECVDAKVQAILSHAPPSTLMQCGFGIDVAVPGWAPALNGFLNEHEASVGLAPTPGPPRVSVQADGS
ncbi:uncharacterized protein EV422DRAFT_249748 [Fimicolochytrium jonesii]|uniref:uncharacterized protein n=1 Tax=Fimicolochytrium jonesii TaxID=1396493 RepID=UPI0022FEBD49|nr:uncharacterized protein EV422DRAFT_249748 [Fimicolochytrium jonesii]KAI8825198.1 hypothetical protein EV422DRAFT_249748 [Fimicolochytrium jonesii]